MPPWVLSTCSILSITGSYYSLPCISPAESMTPIAMWHEQAISALPPCRIDIIHPGTHWIRGACLYSTHLLIDAKSFGRVLLRGAVKARCKAAVHESNRSHRESAPNISDMWFARFRIIVRLCSSIELIESMLHYYVFITVHDMVQDGCRR